jgi:hypothetical protein
VQVTANSQRLSTLEVKLKEALTEQTASSQHWQALLAAQQDMIIDLVKATDSSARNAAKIMVLDQSVQAMAMHVSTHHAHSAESTTQARVQSAMLHSHIFHADTDKHLAKSTGHDDMSIVHDYTALTEWRVHGYGCPSQSHLLALVGQLLVSH